MISLKNYQQDAVTELTDVVISAIGTNVGLVKCPEILFHAPTGAGKTIMMGQFMQQVIDSQSTEDPISFIWVSIGKGDLVTQSQSSVQRNTSIPTYNADDILSGSVTSLQPNTCLFISWDKMNMKDKEGNWVNKIMIDGDNGSLPRVMYNTSLTNTKLIVIIDESHTSASTVRAQELLGLMAPKVIVNVTATPRDTKNLYAYIKIDPRDVIAEGMIKSSLEINSKLKASATSDVVQVLIDAALNKQQQLIKSYQVVKSNIIPLCLIQLPDGQQSASLLEEIETYLETKWQITEENGLLAETFTGVKINFDGIENLHAQQRVLIFKTAIDTGWDCPRAQILVKFRAMKSECFKRQIVGRILRMPEHKHYGIQLLNKGYIYTDEEAFSVDDDTVLDKIELQNVPITVREEFKNYTTSLIFPSFTLPKELRLRLDYDLFFPSFSNFFVGNWDRYMNNYKNNSEGIYASIMNEQSIGTEELLQNETLGVEEKKKFIMSTPMLKSKILKSLVRAMKNSADATAVLEYIASFKPQGVKAKEYYSVIYYNLNDICTMCSELVATNTIYPYVDPSQILNIWVSIPSLYMVSESRLEDSLDTKCIMSGYLPTSKALTNTLIKSCEGDSNILFWYPNFNMQKEYKIRVPLFTDSFHYISPDIITFSQDNKMCYHFTSSEADTTGLQQSLSKYLGGLNLPSLQWSISTPWGSNIYSNMGEINTQQETNQDTTTSSIDTISSLFFGQSKPDNQGQYDVSNDVIKQADSGNSDDMNFTNTGFTNTGFGNSDF